MKNIVKNRQNLIEKASALRFASLRFAQGLRTGNFRSLFHGQGMEFSGVRDYFIGDDVRNIDWNVTARMNRPFVKVWTEERELVIFLLVDRSLSMEAAFLHRSKLEIAGEIAMLFAFAAEKNSCSIGGALFDSQLSFFMAPSNNKNQILHLVQNIDLMPENRERGSALDAAVIKTAKTLKNRTMVVAISDFRIGNFEESLGKLSHNNDIIAIRIVDEIDYALPKLGTMNFFDKETRQKGFFPTASTVFQNKWKNYFEQSEKRFSASCKKIGAIPLEIQTNEDYVSKLTAFFREGR